MFLQEPGEPTSPVYLSYQQLHRAAAPGSFIEQPRRSKAAGIAEEGAGMHRVLTFIMVGGTAALAFTPFLPHHDVTGRLTPLPGNGGRGMDGRDNCEGTLGLAADEMAWTVAMVQRSLPGNLWTNASRNREGISHAGSTCEFVWHL